MTLFKYYNKKQLNLNLSIIHYAYKLFINFKPLQELSGSCEKKCIYGVRFGVTLIIHTSLQSFIAVFHSVMYYPEQSFVLN